MSIDDSISIFTVPTKRGRPVGTGINDSRRLERIVEIMDRQPGLAASWVIREMLHIANPSVVRRLRNKLRRQRPDLIRRWGCQR